MRRILLPLLALGLAGALRADYAAQGDPQPGAPDGGPRFEESRGPGEDGPGPEHGGPGMHGGLGGDPAALKARLDLSDEQVKKLLALREERKEIKALRRECRDKMAKLSDLVEDKASDAQISTALRDFEAAQAKMKAAHEKLKDEREAILTPTQRAKLITSRHGKMGMGGHGGMKDGREGDGPRKGPGRRGPRGEGAEGPRPDDERP